ncbi:MAG: hypothetical protein IJN66_04615 [Muribaculaceae bacterium]|nr:hypothetical protein [Muribaculaceae bacterium]
MKKKSILMIAMMAFGMTMSAAELTVVSTEKIGLSEEAHHPTLSPNGDVVLFTKPDYKGLKSLNLVTNEVKVIDESVGAGFEPVFSADGKEITFKTEVIVDGLGQRDVKNYNFETENKNQIIKPSRKNFDTRALVNKTYASTKADKQSISVSIDGRVQEINPIIDGHRYIWSSLSPSKGKLLFNEIYSGLFVSELDGSKAQHLAMRADFPCWAGDNFIIALKTKDDGYVVTSAKIIAINVATKEVIELTNDDILVAGVTATADKIVYTTEEGEMYLMNIKITE